MSKKVLLTLAVIGLTACSAEPTIDMTTKESQEASLAAVLASDELSDKNRKDIKASVELWRQGLEITKGTDREQSFREEMEKHVQGKTGLEILKAAEWEI